MAYDMMISKGQRLDNWATNIKKLLCTYGYENVWLSQEVEDEGKLLCTLRQKLIERFNYDWNERLSKYRFSIYSLYKRARYFETYLDVVNKQTLRESLTRFRFGISDIKVHKLRYCPGETNLLCPMCTEEDEDEIHFLLHCPVYNDLRSTYILSDDVPPNVETFVKIMSNTSDQQVWALSLYVHYAMRRRNNADADVNTDYCL